MSRKKPRVYLWALHLRQAKGNMIAFMSACAVAFIVLLLFALSYVRLLGSHGEQKTAIEAASLAAAKDISKIVINDPNFGYIGFSDSAPVGAATKAPDNYFMPVSSINSLMGTIRLDLTIANQLGSSEMKQLAQNDLTNLQTAKDNLVAVIRGSLVPGSTATDADGNTVTPYEDALAAYQSNSIRMSGSSSYVANSLQLSLGSVANGETNIPIPSPASYANTSSSQQSNGNYLANIDIPTSDGTHFVFANIGSTARLVDPRNFQTTIAGLPYDMPSIVKAEATQSMSDNGTQRIVHAASCAQPSNLFDPKPAPGALSIAFPDGVPPEVSKPGDLLSPPFTAGAPVVGKTPTSGDYPTDPGTSLSPVSTWPGLGGPPSPAGAVSVGFYDWMRRAGPKLKVDSVIGMMNTVPFTDSGNGADNVLTTNYYTIDNTTGNIIYTARKLSDPSIAPPNVGSYNPPGPDPISVVSQNQMFATALNALTSADTFAYDMYVRDFGWKRGTANGGKHGGEPLGSSLLTAAATATHVSSSNMTIACADLEPVKIAMGDRSGTGSSYDCGGQGDGAHWGIQLGGPPGTLLASLNLTDPLDGHQLTFEVYTNALFTRNDFGLPMGAPYATYTVGPSGGYNRPTYLQNGVASEIRFRRAIGLTLTGLIGAGYASTGNRAYPPPPPYPVSPSFNLP
jgi:hypothetical protein